MKFISSVTRAILIGGSLSVLFDHSASATPSLRLTSGLSSVTVVDNEAGDRSSTDGAIVFIGPIGDFVLNFTTGISAPALGGYSDPFLVFSSSSLSTSAGTLTIEFSDFGFGPSSVDVKAAFGGVTSGSVAYETYIGKNLFERGTLLTTLGDFGPGEFDGEDLGTILDPKGPYSLTQVVTITHSGFGVTTFGANIDVPPVSSVPDSGSTFALLGLTLLGAEGIRRRSASKLQYV